MSAAPIVDLPHPTPEDRPAVEDLRAESRATLTQLVTMLGYPPHWADELERRSFAAGRVWSPR